LEPFDKEELVDSAADSSKGPAKTAALSSGAITVDDIKRWIIDGQFPKAERAINARLTKKPNDVESLQLLAACMRKAGKYQAAVVAYQKIIKAGNSVEQNQARFKAGAILQDRLGKHEDAVRYFDEYLAKPGSLRPNTVEARMRLARSFHAVGRDKQYRDLLALIVREHGGTEAAVKAGKQLEALESN
jgi:thioredoxin-like negative regulator of GroEL